MGPTQKLSLNLNRVVLKTAEGVNSNLLWDPYKNSSWDLNPHWNFVYQTTFFTVGPTIFWIWIQNHGLSFVYQTRTKFPWIWKTLEKREEHKEWRTSKQVRGLENHPQVHHLLSLIQETHFAALKLRTYCICSYSSCIYYKMIIFSY